MKELNKKAKEEGSKSKTLLGDESEHGYEVSVCVLACVLCVLAQTWPVDMMCVFDFSVPEFEVTESQTCTFTTARQQWHIGTRAAEDIGSKHGKDPPVAVPEAVRNRPTPQSAQYKAVLECVRNTGLLLPKATPLQVRPTWLAPPSTPPPEVRDTPRSDHSFHGIKESSRHFDANR